MEEGWCGVVVVGWREGGEEEKVRGEDREKRSMTHQQVTAAASLLQCRWKLDPVKIRALEANIVKPCPRRRSWRITLPYAPSPLELVLRQTWMHAKTTLSYVCLGAGCHPGFATSINGIGWHMATLGQGWGRSGCLCQECVASLPKIGPDGLFWGLGVGRQLSIRQAEVGTNDHLLF
ncbi:unnamed protein product [Pleuronectes platessa]|uniref:Uncharacterized protein n=1 Tax=Pleuronectes platessa TaxID=8262 RepID=A0A9N7Z5F5_PLEPL|nr:unnamed protein product [Pleuronectes platessa]